MILPLFDEADFMIESANRSKISRLDKLQEEAVLYVNNSFTENGNVDYLYEKYGLQAFMLRRWEYHSCIMFRLSKMNINLDVERPDIHLRSRNKVRFKTQRKRKYEKYQKSSMVCGVNLWEMLPEKVQKGTTNVKFKALNYKANL